MEGEREGERGRRRERERERENASVSRGNQTPPTSVLSSVQSGHSLTLASLPKLTLDYPDPQCRLPSSN